LLRRLPFCCLCCVWADSCVCEMCGKNPRFCCGCCRLGLWLWIASWVNSTILLRQLPFCCLCCVWANSCVACEMCGKNPRFCCGCCWLVVVALALDYSGCGKIPRFRCGSCRCMCSVRSELLRDVGKFYDFVAAVAVVCGLCRVWADCERLACAMSASP